MVECVVLELFDAAGEEDSGVGLREVDPGDEHGASGSDRQRRALLVALQVARVIHEDARFERVRPVTAAVSSVEVRLSPDPDRAAVEISATCKTSGQTGVEMEAMTAVAIAALTVYDMVKAVDRGVRLTDIRLTHKSGGKSGTYDAAD